MSECANTSKKLTNKLPAIKFNSRATGAKAEGVALQYLVSTGARLICRNLPTIYAEVDLVFLSAADEILLVEVKLVEHDRLAFAEPVSSRQMQRLRRLLERWIESSDRPVRLHLAAVNHADEVLLFEDFLS